MLHVHQLVAADPDVSRRIRPRGVRSGLTRGAASRRIRGQGQGRGHVSPVRADGVGTDPDEAAPEDLGGGLLEIIVGVRVRVRGRRDEVLVGRHDGGGRAGGVWPRETRLDEVVGIQGGGVESGSLCPRENHF